jgi:hypothetical protein
MSVVFVEHFDAAEPGRKGLAVRMTGRPQKPTVEGVVCRVRIDPNPTFVDPLESSVLRRFEKFNEDCRLG